MKLKVCGMKYQDNINEVAALQPDYLGFIFYKKSSRFFEGGILKVPNNIKKVGVFVNASLDEVIEKINKYDLKAIQLHGAESPTFCEAIKQYDETHHEGELEIIKAFAIDAHFNFDILTPYESVCDYYLFDSKGKLPGGNGYVFDWSVLKNYPTTKPYFLSGGIGMKEQHNLKTFFETDASKYCYAIDVNSQFERAAGMKDAEKIKEFKNQLLL